MSRSRLFTVIAGGLAAVLLAWVAWLLVGGRQVREGVAWARQRMAEGRVRRGAGPAGAAGGLVAPR